MVRRREGFINTTRIVSRGLTSVPAAFPLAHAPAAPLRIDGSMRPNRFPPRSRLVASLLFGSLSIATWLAPFTNLRAAPLQAAQQPATPAHNMAEVLSFRIELSEAEFAALEPTPAQFPGFGGPPPGFGQPPPPNHRETASNMFGTQFPWVTGELNVKSSQGEERLQCRVRYDGDFTYLLSVGGPKRPLAIELLDDHKLFESRAFRLHSLLFDPTQLRELTSVGVFKSLEVPVPNAFHTEVEFAVGEQPPRYVGLYTTLQAVGPDLLAQHGLPADAYYAQLNGLNTLQYLGEEWTPYAPLFRSTRVPSQSEQKRIIAFAKLIGSASDTEFASTITEFIDVDACLRYIAAVALTSNVTGLSTMGTNDYLVLNSATGKFQLVAAEMETALGGAALSGTPEQLADLSLLQPYAGECKLVARLFNDTKIKAAYLEIVRTAAAGNFSGPTMTAFVDSLESSSAAARERDRQAAEERAQLAAAAFNAAAGGGFGAPPAGGFGGGPGGFGGGPVPPPPMDVRTFIQQRHASLARQLSGEGPGYVPSLPNFGGGGFGGGGFGGGGFGGAGGPAARAPITDSQFRDEVQVPEGFAATLFARAPEVNYPVAIAAEPSGAIYVASDEQGSLGTDKNGGKILRCVDQDGDGVMDTATTFCRVDHVRGVLYRGGKVWVCHPPYLSVFQDQDGDGIADRQQQLVSALTTDMVNTRGGDHTTNGIRMGIDGWIYIGDGDYGVPNATGSDGSTVVLRGGGILRVRPDGTELELVCSGLRNPFDIAIDPQLNMFTRDNTNDGGGWDTRVSQLFMSAEYGYPRLFANFSDEIMPTLGAFGGGGGTGGLYIEDPAWPEHFNHSLFTGDWGRSAVFNHPLQADGPTFALTQAPFISVPRATGMDMDAEGNLYVASWWSGEASVYVGPQVGFVTRIAPTNSHQRQAPQLAASALTTASLATASLKSATLPELIEGLLTPQAVWRFHVQGELTQRGEDPATLPALRQLVLNPQLPLNSRVAALFAIKEIEGSDSQSFMLERLADRELREFAMRALTDRKSQLAGLTAALFIPFLNDDSPRVQAQTLIALGRLGDASIAEALLPQAASGSWELPDPAQPNTAQVLPHLALRSLVQLNAIDACLRAIEGDYWRGALRALRSMHSAAAVDGLLARLQTVRDTDRRTEILVTLIRLSHQETPYDGSWWGIRPDTTGPYYAPQRWEQSDRIEAVLATAINQADSETAARLKSELSRHQVVLAGIASENDPQEIADTKPIVIDPVDPTNVNQIGNMSYQQALAKALVVAGNATRGGELFQARSCNSCHTSSAGERPVGPHLADIGKRYKAEELVESILKPSEKIAQGYETQQVLLDSGQVYVGFVVGENGRQILLRDSQGKTHTLVRDEIELRSRQNVSSMPDGLTASLTAEQLADLIAYLQTL